MLLEAHIAQQPRPTHIRLAYQTFCSLIMDTVVIILFACLFASSNSTYILDRLSYIRMRQNKRLLNQNFMANQPTIFLFTLGLTIIAMGTQKI